jgi:NRPS condensation-like uncharacterized protein
MNDFPSFKYVLKNGVFWYYLEKSKIRPIVAEEDTAPCSTIYLKRKSLLFDITWYGKRINFEAYHVLTDGTGGMRFLKMLVINYLKLIEPETLKAVIAADDTSESHKMNDSFRKYYSISSDKIFKEAKKPVAYQIKGAKEPEWRMNITEGVVSAKALLDKAREYGTTATIFLSALLIRSIYDEMNKSDTDKPVVVSVPVNLRNYFASETTRNFFSLINIDHNFNDCENTLEDIIAHAKKCFDEQLNEKHLQNYLNRLLKLERNFLLRIVPLPIKNIVINAVYSSIASRVTSSLSNIGRVTMPDEVKPYIKRFGVLNSTRKIGICICSYEDNLCIGITSPFVSKDIQNNFFRGLTSMGIDVEITENNLKSPPVSEVSEVSETGVVSENAEQKDSAFPYVPLITHKHSRLYRVLQLCSAAVVIFSLMINRVIPQSGFWSLFVVAGVICLWLSLAVAVRVRHNILKNLNYQVVMVSVLSVLWDLFTGWRGWSVDYVIPIAFITAMAATVILANILKMPTISYILYSFILMLYGFIPIAFVLSGLSTVTLPSLICVACSLFSLAALLCFQGRNMIDELKKRTHL